MPFKKLDRRRTLITGAARGIGRAIAQAFLEAGAPVVLTDVDDEALQATRTELATIGPDVHAYPLDVRDAAAFEGLVATVEQDHGPIDILVNNAGIMRIGEFLSQAPETDTRQIDINLYGVIHGVRAVLPRMRSRGRGHIVNIASVAGRVAAPHSAIYSATKHAIVGLTESLRRENLDLGVGFSYVLPSAVDTDLTAGTHPLRWPAPQRPEDVAHAVIRAIRTGKVDLYVPRASRLSVLMPALLPRAIYEPIARWFGVDDIFSHIDDHARSGYRERVETESPKVV